MFYIKFLKLIGTPQQAELSLNKNVLLKLKEKIYPLNMPQKQMIQTIAFVILGVALTIIGTINYFFMKDILRLYNKKLLKISPTMRFYEEWKNTPTHILNRIYMFNFTNVADFERNGTKPIMKELGPYTFKEYQKKINITWNSNDTVTYRVHRVWYFEPEMSNGTLDDNITTVSVIPTIVARMFGNKGYLMEKMGSIALASAGEKFYETRTFNEYTFEGYDYPFSLVGTYYFPTMQKMGYFHTYNDSSIRDGVLNVDTGGSNIRHAGKVKFWDYSPYAFQSTLINGTTGELFSSELPKTNMSLFTPWMCRDLHFDYVGEEWVHGIRGYKFAASKRNIDNGSIYEENLSSWPERRFPSGIMNLSQCYYDGLLIGSFPHFYMADPYFASQIDGMRPSYEDHDSYYIIEPVSGAPLKARIFGQANFLMYQYKYIRFYQNIPPATILPMFWIEKSFEVPHTIVEFLQMYFFVVNILEKTALPCMVIGVFIILVTAIWNIRPSLGIAFCYRRIFWRRGSAVPSSTKNPDIDKKYHFTKLPQNHNVIENNVKVNAPD